MWIYLVKKELYFRISTFSIAVFSFSTATHKKMVYLILCMKTCERNDWVIECDLWIPAGMCVKCQIKIFLYNLIFYGPVWQKINERSKQLNMCRFSPNLIKHFTFLHKNSAHFLQPMKAPPLRCVNQSKYIFRCVQPMGTLVSELPVCLLLLLKCQQWQPREIFWRATGRCQINWKSKS